MDGEALLLGAQGLAELFARFGELAIAQEEITVDGVRLAAFGMGLLQRLDQAVRATDEVGSIVRVLAFALGHLEEADEHLHLGVDVQIGIEEGEPQLIIGLFHLAHAVVMLRQGDAQHAVVRCQFQGLAVLLQCLFVFALLVVDLSEQAHVLGLVGIGLHGTFHEGLCFGHAGVLAQHAEFLHDQLFAQAEALFLVVEHLDRLVHLAAVSQHVGQVEVDLVPVGPFRQYLAVHVRGLVHLVVLGVEIGQEEAVPDVLLVSRYRAFGVVNRCGKVLSLMVQLGQFEIGRTIRRV